MPKDIRESVEQIRLEDWKEKAIDLFGDDMKDWEFRCVSCGEVQTMRDFIEAGVEDPQNKVYYSCIGRYVEDRGCDWTLGGLFKLHKIEVIAEDGTEIPAFEFATEENAPDPEAKGPGEPNEEKPDKAYIGKLPFNRYPDIVIFAETAGKAKALVQEKGIDAGFTRKSLPFTDIRVRREDYFDGYHELEGLSRREAFSEMGRIKTEEGV